MDEISTTRNEFNYLALDTLFSIRYTQEEATALKELMVNSIFHTNDFIQEIDAILEGTTAEEFEIQKKEFLENFHSAIPDSENIAVIYALFLHSKVKKYEEALDMLKIIALIDEDTGGEELLKETVENLKSAIDAKILSLSMSCYPLEQRETKISAIQQLPQLKSKLPESHIMPINRLANELQHDIINRGAIDLIVAGKDTENEITNYTCVTFDSTDSIKMSGKPYTEYDRQVQNNICSLWEYGHEEHVFTSEMLFRAMTHDTGTGHPSPQQIGAVTKSIEKMRRIHVEVDATEEMKKLGVSVNGEPIKSCKFNEFLLSLREVEVKAGGKIVRAYKILGEPILLTYAKMTKQMATVSSELLAVKEVVKDKSTDKIKRITDSVIASSEIRIAVKGYLLRRIAVIKNDKKNKSKKQSNVIKFESLFEETGIQKDSKTARNIKEYCYQVLDYWKGMKFIKDYEKRESKGKGRKSIDAVSVKI